MKRKIDNNIVEVSECRLRDIFHLLREWMYNGNDFGHKDNLKGWILFGGCYFRFEKDKKEIYMALRKRAGFTDAVIEFTESRMEQFILKNFSGSSRQGSEVGYKLGIQDSTEPYIIFTWTVPRYKEELEADRQEAAKEIAAARN